MFREAFLNKLNLLLRGTVAAPADRFGETLADEHMMGGEHSFCTVLAHQHAAASPAFAIQTLYKWYCKRRGPAHGIQEP